MIPSFMYLYVIMLSTYPLVMFYCGTYRFEHFHGFIEMSFDDVRENWDTFGYK